MMRTVEIRRESWTARLDEFTRVHEGWPVSMDVMSPALGAQSEFRLLSLLGVTAEPRGDGVISVTVALPKGGYLTHTIHAPVHVRIQEGPHGEESALEIESADGATALLQFRAAPAVHGLVRGRCGDL